MLSQGARGAGGQAREPRRHRGRDRGHRAAAAASDRDGRGPPRHGRLRRGGRRVLRARAAPPAGDHETAPRDVGLQVVAAPAGAARALHKLLRQPGPVRARHPQPGQPPAPGLGAARGRVPRLGAQAPRVLDQLQPEQRPELVHQQGRRAGAGPRHAPRDGGPHLARGRHRGAAELPQAQVAGPRRQAHPLEGLQVAAGVPVVARDAGPRELRAGGRQAGVRGLRRRLRQPRDPLLRRGPGDVRGPGAGRRGVARDAGRRRAAPHEPPALLVGPGRTAVDRHAGDVVPEPRERVAQPERALLGAHGPGGHAQHLDDAAAPRAPPGLDGGLRHPLHLRALRAPHVGRAPRHRAQRRTADRPPRHLLHRRQQQARGPAASARRHLAGQPPGHADRVGLVRRGPARGRPRDQLAQDAAGPQRRHLRRGPRRVAAGRGRRRALRAGAGLFRVGARVRRVGRHVGLGHPQETQDTSIEL
mmetsp:Transcript_16477/g.49196  ORF Transcript_16477/g.49196 Transcript_16477/m.49196 type:complete len:474 (+) Transcript_16477:283-1704(+)